MLSITNTENLTGVSISGDYDDLYNLVDAIHELTIDEYSEKNQGYIAISTRTLGLCYDIRHAYQGDREIDFNDNNMNDEKMKWHAMVTPTKNVYYRCNYLYPETFFIMLALNELVELRIKELTKAKYIYSEAMDIRVIWDDKIALIRILQAEFRKCVKEIFTEATYTRLINVMKKNYLGIKDIAGQYLDTLNIQYIKLTKEKRLKKLPSIIKRIVEFRFDNEHKEIKRVVTEAAKEHGCDPADIELMGMEYPEDIPW